MEELSSSSNGSVEEGAGSERVALKVLTNSPLLRWAGEWVDSVDAKHAGADLEDAIIKIYCGKHKCD